MKSADKLKALAGDIKSRHGVAAYVEVADPPKWLGPKLGG